MINFSNKLIFIILILLFLLVGIPIVTMGILLCTTNKTSLFQAIDSLNVTGKTSIQNTSNKLLNISKKTIIQSNSKFVNLSRKIIEQNSKNLIQLNKYSLLNNSKQQSNFSSATILSIGNDSLKVSTDAILENGNNLINLSHKSLENAIISGNQEKAEKISRDISFSINEAKSLLSVFGKLRDIKKMNVEASTYMLSLLQRDYPSLENISLINTSGQEVLRVSTNDAFTQNDLKDFSSSSIFKTAIKGGFYISNVKISKRLYPYVTIAFPTQVYAGNYSGVLSADLNLSKIGSLVDESKVGQKGYTFVVDSSGEVIFHPNKQLVLNNTNFSSMPIVAAVKKNGKSSEIFKLNNEEVLGVGTLVKNLNWVVIVIQPTSEAFEVSQAMKSQVEAEMVNTINKIKSDTKTRESFAVKNMESRTMQASMESQKNMYDKTQEHVNKSVKLLTNDAQHSINSAVNELGFTVQKDNNSTIKELQDKSELAAIKATRKVILNSLVIIVLFCIIAVIASIYIARRVANPIEKLTKIGLKLAQDDINVEIPENKKEVDEIINLTHAFKKFVEFFKQNRANEKKMATILDNMNDGVITVNDQCLIESCNPAAGFIFDYAPSDIIGKKLDLLVPHLCTNNENNCFFINECFVKRCISNNFEIKGKRQNGGEFPLEMDVSKIAIEEKPLFIVVLRDITQRKEVERMKNEFISTVSHELRTPLTSIRGALGLVSAGTVGEIPDTVKELLTIATNNSSRLISLINDILDIEKIEAGKMDFNIEICEIMSVINQAIEANVAFAQQFNVKYKLEDVLYDARVMADKDRLMQVLTNLLSNAVKFSPENGTIRISILRQNEFIHVTIADEGQGIAEKFQDKLFQKFIQADSSDTRNKGGTGLGLSICKAIMERLGGKIGFNTVIGYGSTFYFDLPEFISETSIISHKKNINVPASIETKLNILHIEDDIDVQKIIYSILKNTANISQVKNLKEAKTILNEKNFELVLLDLNLPDGNGAELLPLLNNANQKIPTIIFSAYEVDEKLALQVDGVLLKSKTSNNDLLNIINSIKAKKCD